jgi:hypothetical protein
LIFCDAVENFCWRGAYDIQFKDDRLFISGYTDTNGDGYDFYYFYLTKQDGMLNFGCNYILQMGVLKKRFQFQVNLAVECTSIKRIDILGL